jgi:integrase
MLCRSVVDSNPCRGVKKHPEKGRDRYISDAEFEGVKAIAGELIAAVMEFAYITALRKGDILSLRLDQLGDDGIHHQTRQDWQQAAV